VTGTLAPVKFAVTDWSHLGLHWIVQKLRRAPSSPNTEGIKPRCSESIEFDHSLPQIFAGIRGHTPDSVKQSTLRASLQDQVNHTHLWNLFLHHMVVRSSTSIPTTVLRRRRQSPESLRWPSGHTAATVEFPLVLWFDSEVARTRGEPLASAPSSTVAGDEHQHAVNVLDPVRPSWLVTWP
jgi:hypothetical protein